MNSVSCQRYLEDPEANAAHLVECEKCRALEDGLQASGLGPRSSVDTDRLPLAPWEGASYRSWALVFAGTIIVGAIAAVFFFATGAWPRLPSFDVVVSTARHLGMAAQNAPASWQLVVAVLFIVVNAIFIALLRRAPRGIDV